MGPLAVVASSLLLAGFAVRLLIALAPNQGADAGVGVVRDAADSAWQESSGR